MRHNFHFNSFRSLADANIRMFHKKNKLFAKKQNTKEREGKINLSNYSVSHIWRKREMQKELDKNTECERWKD